MGEEQIGILIKMIEGNFEISKGKVSDETNFLFIKTHKTKTQLVSNCSIFLHPKKAERNQRTVTIGRHKNYHLLKYI